MHRSYHRWYSHTLGRDMELLAFGHAGATILAFPTSRGTFYEWESHGMPAALAHRIDSGHFRLVCVDSVDAESWYARNAHPNAQARRQLEYDDYLLRDVLPFIRGRGGDPHVICAGASFGAFHALSFALRHPEQVCRVVSMSGLCDIRMFTGGHGGGDIYFTNPADFVAHEHDHRRLEAMRRMDIILAVGNGDRLVHQNRALSGALWGKGVGNALREWDGFAHDWPVWHRMINLYVGGRD